MEGHVLVKRLEQPYETVRTMHGSSWEVRLYKNKVTEGHRVGKRVDLLGIDAAIAVNEAMALQDIHHPNVVDVIDVFPVQGFPPPMRVVELIMPYYSRGSLFDAFKRGERFSLAEAVRTAEAALLGLSHLHEVHGILHRDVKPPNLLLAEDSSLVKVSDLGVAVRMDEQGDGPSFTQGVHPYIPPETFIEGRVGRAGDLYGLGLALFELTSGPFPYHEYSKDAIASRLERGRRGPRPRDLAYSPVVPSRLRRIINKAIHPDPAARYPTAASMNERLAALRLVDWEVVLHEPDSVIWEGTSTQRPERAFRVEATKSRRGDGWRVAGLQRVNVWRRVVDDVIAPDLGDPAVARLVDNLVNLATIR